MDANATLVVAFIQIHRIRSASENKPEDCGQIYWTKVLVDTLDQYTRFSTFGLIATVMLFEDNLATAASLEWTNDALGLLAATRSNPDRGSVSHQIQINQFGRQFHVYKFALGAAVSCERQQPATAGLGRARLKPMISRKAPRSKADLASGLRYRIEGLLFSCRFISHMFFLILNCFEPRTYMEHLHT